MYPVLLEAADSEKIHMKVHQKNTQEHQILLRVIWKDGGKEGADEQRE